MRRSASASDKTTSLGGRSTTRKSPRRREPSRTRTASSMLKPVGTKRTTASVVPTRTNARPPQSSAPGGRITSWSTTKSSTGSSKIQTPPPTATLGGTGEGGGATTPGRAPGGSTATGGA
eukprot:2977053-Heterocapsa_arctica.AAC.1